jgi:3-oxoacyl-(acyl-carrier-protein) synthase
MISRDPGEQLISGKHREEVSLMYSSMVIKTACSSAGIALHEALEAIRENKITAAVITGSNLIMGKPLQAVG